VPTSMSPSSPISLAFSARSIDSEYRPLSSQADSGTSVQTFHRSQYTASLTGHPTRSP
jgi:hypothetical protein